MTKKGKHGIRLIYSAVCLSIIGFAFFAKSSIDAFRFSREYAAIHSDLVLGKDLIADILPPPDFIVETYLTVFEIRENIGNADVSQTLIADIQRLKAQYNDRHTYWQQNTTFLGKADALQNELLVNSHKPAEEVFRCIDEEFIPAVTRGDRAAATEIIHRKITPLYKEHKAGIDHTVMIANAVNSRNSVILASVESRRRESQIHALLIVLVFIAAGILVLISRHVLFRRKNRQLQQLNDKLHELSMFDSLTSLNNRHFLMSHLDRIIQESLDGSDAEEQLLGVFVVDLDFFKSVNDKYGHPAGDEVLRQSAARLKLSLREHDIIIRWGGEEFLILIRRTGHDLAKDVAGRICRAIGGNPFSAGTGDMTITCSVGYFLFSFGSSPDNHTCWDSAVHIADLALYEAKRQGRNRFLGAHMPNDDPAQREYILSEPVRAIREGLITFS